MGSGFGGPTRSQAHAGCCRRLAADVRRLSIAAAVVIVPVSLLHFTSSLGFLVPGWQIVAPVAELVAPLRSVNTYGLFAVMTTTRPEIIVEGSDDGERVAGVRVRLQARRSPPPPAVVAPHQPRLDWQMWFARR